MAHDIRLMGPWEYSLNCDSDTFKCRLPIDVDSRLLSGSVVSDGSASEIHFRRPFHRPTGLDTSSKVFVRLTTSRLVSELRLNQAVVQPVQPPTQEPEKPFIVSLFDVTTLLQAFNTLELRISLTDNESSQQRIELVQIRIVEQS